MDIIIVGCGKQGDTLAEQLCREGHNISVIDIDRKKVEAVSGKYDVLGVVGNGASYAVQMEAGIEKADLLIATAGMDELNLLCCLIAKKAGDCHTIARVRNPEYSQEIELFKEELGLSMIINPEQAAAVEISRLLRFPSAIMIETFAKGRVEILKFKIPSNCILCNYLVKDIAPNLHCDILVCAVERGEEVIIPKGDCELKENDIISIIAQPKMASAFFKKIAIATGQARNSMIVGGGEIAFYLTKILLHMGIDVTIIERDEDRCELLTDLLPKAMIINGDAIDQNVLLEEGLETVDAFVTLTNMDEENIMLSLFAASKSDAKLVTKVHRITFDEIVQKLDLGSIICPKRIAADYITQYVRAMQNSMGSSNVETLYKIIEDKAEALEFKVKKGSPVIGKPLASLRIHEDIIVACINHKGKITIPHGQDVILEDDSVVVVTSAFGLDDIADILKD